MTSDYAWFLGASTVSANITRISKTWKKSKSGTRSSSFLRNSPFSCMAALRADTTEQAYSDFEETLLLDEVLHCLDYVCMLKSADVSVASFWYENN